MNASDKEPIFKHSNLGSPFACIFNFSYIEHKGWAIVCVLSLIEMQL